jgi:DNA processing protein
MDRLREAYVVLNRAAGIGPIRARALCEAFGGPEEVLAAPAGALAGVRGIGAKVAEELARQREEIDAEEEERRAAACGARIVTPADEGYPEPLRRLHDAPLCLYVRGEWREGDELSLAVVGTRRASVYGKAQAERLAFAASKAGFCIVSGLARGIDTAAHRGALKAGGRTVAVLGGALDKLYPPENAGLADEIAAGRGAVISEFPMGRSPDRTTFPYRNRLVSGLSKGVLVVEAGLNSGAMQTADLAVEQGKSVLAVPGRVDMEGAEGPHRLIRDGARLTAGLEDILKEFEFELPGGAAGEARREVDGRAAERLSPAEARVVKALWRDAEADLDEVVRRTGLSAAQLLTVSMQLEMKRVVRRLPGRRLALAEGVRQGRLGGIE